MKRFLRPLGLMLILAGCQTGNSPQTIVPDEYLGIVTPQVPEGYPWKMGDGVVTLDGVARAYTTYDFSIGAFDAAVQFRTDYDCSGTGSCADTGKILLSLRAHPDANPDADADVIAVTGVFDAVPDGPVTAQNVSVSIAGSDGWDGKILLSNTATMTLTKVKRGKDGSQSYGTLSATVTATVCEADKEVMIEGGACHEITATFDTEVQYDSV